MFSKFRRDAKRTMIKARAQVKTSYANAKASVGLKIEIEDETLKARYELVMDLEKSLKAIVVSLNHFATGLEGMSESLLESSKALIGFCG